MCFKKTIDTVRCRYVSVLNKCRYVFFGKSGKSQLLVGRISVAPAKTFWQRTMVGKWLGVLCKPKKERLHSVTKVCGYQRFSKAFTFFFAPTP